MSQNLLHSRCTRSDAAFGSELECNLVAASTRIHTGARLFLFYFFFKENAQSQRFLVGIGVPVRTSDDLVVDCALTGAASPGSTRWPNLPSAPIGTDGRTCKSNVPIDVFQKRIKGTRAAFQLLYCATVRRFNDKDAQISPAVTLLFWKNWTAGVNWSGDKAIIAPLGQSPLTPQ